MGGTFKKKGTFSQAGGINTTTAGTPSSSITTTDYINGKDIVTVLTFTNLDMGAIPNGAAAGLGVLIYTFPPGSHIHVATYMDITCIQGSGDTIKLGIGSLVASGAVSVLNGTSRFMNYITEQTVIAASSPGTNTKKLTVSTAGALAGISINEAGTDKGVYINIAATWSANPISERSVSVTGQVTLKWTKMS